MLRAPQRRGGRQPVAGFTLIELLVVVAIIALLISILLPSLNAARDQAKLAVSLSNQRNIGTAMASTGAEYNDFYPTWDDGNSSTGTIRYMYTWVDTLFDLEFIGDPKIGICPADKRVDEVMELRGEVFEKQFVETIGAGQAPQFGVRTSYALNAVLHMNFRGDLHPDAARQVLAISGWWNWFSSLNAAFLTNPQGRPWNWPDNQASMIAWRHGQRRSAAALFRDGHAEALNFDRPDSIEESLTSTVDTVRAFAWLPGESTVRRVNQPYEGQSAVFNPPWAVLDYFGRVPEWVEKFNSGSGKTLGGEVPIENGPNFHPYNYPDELSASWRTANRAWSKLPNNEVDRN